MLGDEHKSETVEELKKQLLEARGELARIDAALAKKFGDQLVYGPLSPAQLVEGFCEGIYPEMEKEFEKLQAKVAKYETPKYEILGADIHGVYASTLKGIDGNGKATSLGCCGITIGWSAKGEGFGEIEFLCHEDETFEANTEHMSREFVQAVFKYMTDKMVIKD